MRALRSILLSCRRSRGPVPARREPFAYFGSFGDDFFGDPLEA